ncbi:MAG TPA: sugar transferase [Chloroflexota bacterium]|nr:sugar transferase [Chloroflexota bacterium]
MQDRTLVAATPLSAAPLSDPQGGAPSTIARAPRASVQTRRRAALAVAGCALSLDAAIIWLAFCASYYLRYTVQWVPGVERGTLWVPFSDWIPFGISFSLVELASLLIAGSYRERLGRDLLDEVLVSCRTSLVGIGLVVIVTAFLPIKLPSRLVILYTWLLLIPLLALGRAVLAVSLGRLYGRGWNTRRVLVAGTTPIGKMVMQNLLGKQKHGYQLVGFLQESPPLTKSGGPGPLSRTGNFGRFQCLGTVADLGTVIEQYQVDEVIVTLAAALHHEIGEICAHCESARVAVKLVPDLFEMSLSRVHMDHLAGIPLIDVHSTHPGRAARAVKRGMDIVIAGLALLVTSPILVLTALAIKSDSRGPILNKQRRVGKGGVEFTFFKFRSMYVDADRRREALLAEKGIVDPRIFKDRHDPRRTRVGRLIRRLSIDELPQLFNVLKGDMSLVGPRPPLPHEVAQYEPHHFKRLEVIGGITGNWQVNGRSNIESFEEIIMMDTYYIDNWSLGLDLKILLRTVMAVITRNGAY